MKSKNKRRGNFKKLLLYMRTKKILLACVIIFSLISVVFEILLPIEIGIAINYIVAEGSVNFSAVFNRILVVILFAGVGALSQYIQSQAGNRLSYKISAEVRNDLFDKIHRLSLSFLDSTPTGDTVSRLINDVDLLGNGLLQTFSSFFTGLSTILGVIIIMLFLNVKIGLLVIILTPISMLVSSLIANKTYKYFQGQLALRGELGSFVDEMASGVYTTRAFTYEGRSQKAFEEINQRLEKSGILSQFFGALVNPTARVLNSLVYGAVGIVGSLNVISGALSVGVFSSFLAYANQYTKPFNEISAVINQMQTALAASERIFDYLESPEIPPSRNNLKIEDHKGNISIDSIYFSYVKGQRLIEDFSIEVKAGQTVAIVGPTGAGKSTIINLLMRFYEQKSGSILIDGIDCRDMERNYLRRLFGMVLQDPWIFKGSIRDNIAYGKPNASMDEIIEASKKANLHDLVEKMDDGYKTILEENGSNISTGQRQLISIARIMLLNPLMLILDEATSSIDTMTEKAIQDAFDSMMKDKTAFVVAHRLSTIQNADLILVMKDGNIVEKGKHEELLEKNGFYHKLYFSQYDQEI